MIAVARYYAYGIFRGESHPVPKRKEAKHNPLQRIVYLNLAALLLPIQMITGFLYWSYNSWSDWGISGLSLQVIAWIHMAGTFAIFSFIIIHVYMTTTGHTIFAHIKAMISGWEDVEEDAKIEDWKKKNIRPLDNSRYYLFLSSSYSKIPIRRIRMGIFERQMADEIGSTFAPLYVLFHPD
jgi:cytochrome b subunit of formate dehydrogenase